MPPPVCSGFNFLVFATLKGVCQLAFLARAGVVLSRQSRRRFNTVYVRVRCVMQHGGQIAHHGGVQNNHFASGKDQAGNWATRCVGKRSISFMMIVSLPKMISDGEHQPRNR